jgi:transposase-like protein
MDKKRRIFSDEFKKEKVNEIESGILSISQLCRLYGVSSSSVYQWLYRYGHEHKKGVRMVVEKESESVRTAVLLGQVSDLERLLGQKQVEIEYLRRVIAEGDRHFDCDLKKSFAPPC